MKIKYIFLVLVLATTILPTYSTIIYTDVVPDLVTAAGPTSPMFDVDLDNNSSPDFRFTCVDVSGLKFIIAQAGQIGLGNFILEDTTGNNHYARALILNANIAPSSTVWHAMSSTNPTLFSDFLGTMGGLWLLSQDYYLGVKFLIGANTHYGWIRMNINAVTAVVTLKDYAYEDIPNTPILAGALPGADVAKNVIATDVNDNSNGSDMQVVFNKATNENTVDHYRIIVARDTAVNFNLSKAQTVSAGNYTTVIPTGSNISVTLNSSMNDANGNPLTIGVLYKVYVLSKANIVVVTGDGLSAVSNTIQLNTQAYPPTAIMGADVGNVGNGQDVEISFNKSVKESGVSKYRIIVMKSADAASFTILDAQNIQLGRYFDVTPTGSNIQTTLLSTTLDKDGISIKEDTAYKAVVLSIANGSLANLDSLSATSNEFILKDTATGISVIKSSDLDFYSVGPNIIFNLSSNLHGANFVLYDLSGKEVYAQRILGGNVQINPGLDHGVYIGLLVVDGKRISKKLGFLKE